ncbi:MAG: VWA domain-containing protein [Phycisphaerales bacterium]|nr:VWA domain-containing protein [Phycisphaerales bacterium]
MVKLLLAIAIGLAALCGEWLHARRTARVRWLVFGPTNGAHSWVAAVPWVRAPAVGILAWGLATLLSLDGAPTDLTPQKNEPTRHLLIALDVSPSMYIEDSGPDARETRGRRAYDVLESVLSRLDVTHTRVSVVAFYTTAKPVVVDTDDLNVVENILRDLPLEHAFKEGQTNMYEGVRAAGTLAEAWEPGSATMILVSDGDTLPDAGLPRMPPSVSDTIVLGVGNPYRGTSIAGRTSPGYLVAQASGGAPGRLLSRWERVAASHGGDRAAEDAVARGGSGDPAPLCGARGDRRRRLRARSNLAGAGICRRAPCPTTA